VDCGKSSGLTSAVRAGEPGIEKQGSSVQAGRVSPRIGKILLSQREANKPVEQGQPDRLDGLPGPALKDHHVLITLHDEPGEGFVDTGQDLAATSVDLPAQSTDGGQIFGKHRQ
jgi:hypothetical protein